MAWFQRGDSHGGKHGSRHGSGSRSRGSLLELHGAENWEISKPTPTPETQFFHEATPLLKLPREPSTRDQYSNI